MAKHRVRPRLVQSLNQTAWKHRAERIDSENYRLKDAIINVRSQIPKPISMRNHDRLVQHMSFQRNPFTPSFQDRLIRHREFLNSTVQPTLPFLQDAPQTASNSSFNRLGISNHLRN